MVTEGMRIYVELVRFSPDRLWITTTYGTLPMSQLKEMDFRWSLFIVTTEWRPF